MCWQIHICEFSSSKNSLPARPQVRHRQDFWLSFVIRSILYILIMFCIFSTILILTVDKDLCENLLRICLKLGVTFVNDMICWTFIHDNYNRPFVISFSISAGLQQVCSTVNYDESVIHHHILKMQELTWSVPNQYMYDWHTYMYVCHTSILAYIYVCMSYIYTGIHICMYVIHLYSGVYILVYIYDCLSYISTAIHIWYTGIH